MVVTRGARDRLIFAVIAAFIFLSLGAGCSAPSERPRGAPQAPAPVAQRKAAPQVLERDAVVAGQRFSYGLHLAPQPNLVYHLDCIAGVSLCARAIFREFWEARGLDAADQAALDTWKALRVRHGGELKRIDRAAPPLPLLVASGTFDLAERQRIAGLVARTPSTYEMATALLSTDADARELAAVLERFAPRFEAWWRERGFAGGAAPFDRFERFLADPFLISFIEKAAHFYEAEIPAGPTLEFHLVVQPASSRRLSVAYQLERHAAVEVVEGGNPEGLFPVLAHEVFHYFFSRMRPERRSAMLERVCASESPFAVAGFGVFDEAVATALGNGLVGQHYTPPEEFAKRLARPDGGLTAFRAAAVVGRALLPSMQGVLDRGTVISSDEFLRAYNAAALSTFEGGRPRPIDYLRTHVLVADPRFAEAIQLLRDVSFAAHPGLREYTSFDAEAKGFLTERPFQPAAIFAPSEAALTAVLEALSAGPKHAAAAAAVAKRARGFVYALPRTPKSYAFIFVTADPQAMKDLVGRFAALTAGGEGVLAELSK